jgi:beta-phosphoglucomutase
VVLIAQLNRNGYLVFLLHKDLIEMIKAVIFDFDGVVADSEFLHYKTFNGALEPFGVNIDKEKYYADYLGYSDADGFEAIVKDYQLNLDQSQRAELLLRKEELFRQVASNESFIISGASDYISMLAENGIRLAICSGSLRSEIELMLSKSDFADAFELIVSADDVKKSKPDPEPYILTLAKLNEAAKIQASECVVIEDSHWGLQSAKAAGLRGVGITNSYPAEELTNYADKVIAALGELTLDALNELCV